MHFSQDSQKINFWRRLIFQQRNLEIFHVCFTYITMYITMYNVLQKLIMKPKINFFIRIIILPSFSFFRLWGITTLSLSLEVAHQTPALTPAKRITDTTEMHLPSLSAWRISKSRKNALTIPILPTASWLSKRNIALTSIMPNSAANLVP